MKLIMPSSNMITILVLISTFIFISLSNSEATTDYRYHVCSNTTIFNPNTTYKSNLDRVLSFLVTNSSIRDTLYHNTSVGRNPGTIVYGSFLCRGDISLEECNDCVQTATSALTQLYCPVEKEAVIWYNNCIIRYSNVSFFGKIAEEPEITTMSETEVTEPERFNRLLASTMTELVTKASNAKIGDKKFAVKKENYTEFQSLYCLVECSPDLSGLDCNRCLKLQVAKLPTCCVGKDGGNGYNPSCYIRFQVFPFYNPTPSSITFTPAPASQGKKRATRTITVVVICGSVVLFSLLVFLGGYYFLSLRSVKGKYGSALKDGNDGNEITTVESLQFDLGTIKTAVNNFSADNKLGEGGFGEVYKGILPNGQEIAVKKLSRSSTQGVGEFKNEVALLAKLQHRNLVRLLGFCVEEDEKILVYEFVHNKSLDQSLFDPVKQVQLNWSKRYKIINGITRGMLYLHEDSRLTIIHRDLKSSNILLDSNINPKISDFGMARIFGVDQTRGKTSKIVGTYGYMSPEYALYGKFSIKSDVYSFGVLMLEIISGKKNSNFYDSDTDNDLLSYACKLWNDGTPLQLLDQSLGDSYSTHEVIRCIHIGLLCVQEDPSKRPTIASIVLMLSSYSISLILPQKPNFFPNSQIEKTITTLGSLSNKSTNKHESDNVNEVSITEISAR